MHPPRDPKVDKDDQTRHSEYNTNFLVVEEPCFTRRKNTSGESPENYFVLNYFDDESAGMHKGVSTFLGLIIYSEKQLLPTGSSASLW